MDAVQAVFQASKNRTIIPAFNIPYLPMLEPVVRAIRDENAVAMMQVARLEWVKFSSGSLEAVAEEYAKHCDPKHTLLHLDHVPVIDEDSREVDYLPIITRAIKAGYQSVMIDGSRLPLDENIAASAKVSALAHAAGVAVEAELGAVAGHEAGGIGMDYETLFASKRGFTDPKEAKVFVSESGCDWLSVAVGSIHGAIAEGVRKKIKPQARLDIAHIAALYEATDGMPLVLHGGSGIRQEYILGAVKSGIAKINVATEIRQPYEAALEERPNDIVYAKDKVYGRTRWVIREFLQISGNAKKLFD
jgi:ketose-bisphosphate aldolase